jgi:hypothetical protein
MLSFSVLLAFYDFKFKITYRLKTSVGKHVALVELMRASNDCVSVLLIARYALN